MKNNKSTIIIVTVVLGLFLLSAQVVAAAGKGITISPLKYKYNVDPGTVIDDYISVVNPNDSDLSVQVEFQDFVVTEGNNIRWVPSDVENPHRMTDWINIDTEPLTIAPQKQVTIPFKISVPKDASAGGKYAAIFFTEKGAGNGPILGSIARVGSLIVLNVNGDLKETGSLLDFYVWAKKDWTEKMGSSFIVWKKPINFTLKMLNVGTTHFEVRPVVEVYNLFWKVANIPADAKIVYPNVPRAITATWEGGAPFGVYHAVATVTDGDGNSFQQTRWFIGIPALYAFIVILAALVLWFGIGFFKHTFKISRISTGSNKSAAHKTAAH